MNDPQPTISAKNIKDEKVRAIVVAARELATEADIYLEDYDDANAYTQVEKLEDAINKVETLTLEYMTEQPINNSSDKA